MTEITVITLLKQLGLAVPSIIVGTQTITAAIKGAFNITNHKVNHAVSWIVAVLAGVGFVAFNGLTFVASPVWANYVLGAVAGLLAGASANGFYNWDSIWTIFQAVTQLFSGGRYVSDKQKSVETNTDSTEEK